MSALAYLPPELYTAVFNHLPPTSLQQTVLSLTRTLPYSPIPLYHLFQHIRLTHSDQAIQLYRRLRGTSSTPSTPDPTAAWIREFSLETWTVDADVVVNLIRLMPRMTALGLCIGPNNFAPEHLEELFAKCIPGLKYLSLRFRPYVQRATYYQFLRGAYFDSTLIALSQWPPSALPTLSIVQDPLDPGLAENRAFAQPLVFFRLDPFASLICSPYLSSLTALRLRIPSRQITRFITTHPLSVPSLQFLDLSTCNVLDAEVDALLTRFVKLRHLVLDGCAVLKGELREGEWGALGKSCALAGVRRAKEREKKLKVWLEANGPVFSDHQAQTGPVQEVDAHAPAARKARRGRRGLATATISLRPSPPRDSVPLPVLHIPIPKIRVLPPSPSLLSLATTTSTLIHPDKYPVVRAEFERGWADGLAQLGATRARLRQSSMNGVRVVQFVDDVDQDGLDGLEDVEMGNEEAFRVREDVWRVPVLCLVGAGRGEDHIEGCGHAVGWKIWKNELE